MHESPHATSVLQTRRHAPWVVGFREHSVADSGERRRPGDLPHEPALVVVLVDTLDAPGRHAARDHHHAPQGDPPASPADLQRVRQELGSST
jgi:hypothetical protein